MRDLIERGQADVIRQRLMDATQNLLGSTIALSDDDWHAPSLLPGWTRAHVATHLARHADALASLVHSSLDDQPPDGPTKPHERLIQLERGAERSGLELQIDLDTAAGGLENAMDEVLDWSATVQMSKLGLQPLAAIPAARFHEIYLHHLDLNCGFTLDAIEPVPASWLLNWLVMMMELRPSLSPNVHLISESGVTATLGSAEERLTVRGADVDVWWWLTGRGDGTGLTGTNGVQLPLLG